MRVTAMANGPHDPEEIVKSVKRGIYAEHFSNGQVMIGAGDYSFYLRSGFRVVGGRFMDAGIPHLRMVLKFPDS